MKSNRFIHSLAGCAIVISVAVLLLAAAAPPLYTPWRAFHGTGGILITTNPATLDVTIDGSGISSPTGGVSATVVTNIARSEATNDVTVAAGTGIAVVTNGVGPVWTYTVSNPSRVVTNVVNAFTNPASGIYGLISKSNSGNVRIKGLAPDDQHSILITDVETALVFTANQTIPTGLTSNANQFAGAPLSLKNGAFQTNLNGFGAGTNDGDFLSTGNLTALGGNVHVGQALIFDGLGNGSQLFVPSVHLGSGGKLLAGTWDLYSAGNNLVLSNTSIPSEIMRWNNNDGSVTIVGELTNILAVNLQSVLRDNSGSAGSAGQLFTSTGSGVGWSNPPATLVTQSQLTLESNALVSLTSNNVVVAAGANVTVTPSGSAGVMTYTVASSAGSGTAAGNSGAIQFNEGGAFAGTNDLLWNRTNNLLTIKGSETLSNSLSIGTNSAGGARLQVVGESRMFRTPGDDNSVDIGYLEGSNATNASSHVGIGFMTMQEAWNASELVAIGRHAGYAASAGDNAVIVGHAAGQYATNSSSAVLIGYLTGRYPLNNFDSVQIGHNAGTTATQSQSTVFIGAEAGSLGSDSIGSVQLGYGAGAFAKATEYSVMGGWRAGYLATNSYYSILLGYKAGYNLSRHRTLIIEGNEQYSTNGVGALIYGEFDNRILVLGGDVGVNTNAPFAKFHVRQTGTNAIARFDSGIANILNVYTNRLNLASGLSDNTDSLGSAGQVLTSTGSGAKWSNSVPSLADIFDSATGGAVPFYNAPNAFSYDTGPAPFYYTFNSHTLSASNFTMASAHTVAADQHAAFFGAFGELQFVPTPSGPAFLTNSGVSGSAALGWQPLAAVSLPTNTAAFNTVAPANLHSITLGKGWTNDLNARADIVMSVKYTDAVSGDPALAFTNTVTGEAWTNTFAFGIVGSMQEVVTIPDISPSDYGAFTDGSGTGATVTILKAWWKLK